MSLRPDSTIAPKTSRPMRPNPLIATFVAIVNSPFARHANCGRTQALSTETAALRAARYMLLRQPKLTSAR
jgi:hypothetical protein